MREYLKAYQARWAEVEAVIAEERRTAPLGLHWQRLNAANAMAIVSGLRQEDASEIGVFERWTKLKGKKYSASGTADPVSGGAVWRGVGHASTADGQINRRFWFLRLYPRYSFVINRLA